MIYSQVTGGFGNQLFNYAIGYSLARKYGEKLTLDISPYHYSPRPFVLDQLAITGLIRDMSPAKKDTRLHRMIARAIRILQSQRYGYCRWIKEFPETRNRYGNYDFHHHGSLYLEGYWQHYRYFHDYYDGLCEEFAPGPNLLSELAKQKIQEVSSCQSVAVHIRKGDYEAAWVLSPSYYASAIQKTESVVTDPVYYIFCEDSEYAKQVCQGCKHPMHFVTAERSLTDLEEFYVMLACKHQIIANSSFSWWAAYLNRNPDKLVIAPLHLHWQKEYYPEEWHLIPSGK